MSSDRIIPVTKPYLPDLSELNLLLKQVWESGIVTNMGPLARQLEQDLRSHLEVDSLLLVANGTLGLMLALRCLELTGEVITTPYTFAATTNSLAWAGLTPVFVDIDPATCNLDPACIEAAITPQTSGILAVHCYGIPCDIDGIQAIADRHSLKVVYDAAHAFGVRYKDLSILSYGDMSVLSFHATKVFHTLEGGAVICSSDDQGRTIDLMRNFGISSETSVELSGINAKMNELSAAVGLLHLQAMNSLLDIRRDLDSFYRDRLGDLSWVQCFPFQEAHHHNYGYFPVLISEDAPLTRDGLYNLLRRNQIHARRYFYPLISESPAFRHLPSARRDNLPIAAKLTDQILCLPIYPELSKDDVMAITDLILSANGS